MFNIDDKFMDEIGLGALPEDEKKAFEDYARNELQERVGERLTEGMDDDTLDEFGYFMDGDLDGMRNWLNAHKPDYRNDSVYKQLVASNPGASETDVLSSYGSLAWLQAHRPDYPKVVEQVMNELKQEIIDNRNAIVAGINEA